jgi:KDO2-lipid IV(A) lauroyltransferase
VGEERCSLAVTTRFAEVERAQRSEVGTLRARGGSGNNGAKFQREDRQEFRYLLSIACAIVASWVARLTPTRLRYWLSDRSGDLFYQLSPTYRENVRANVHQALGPDVSNEALERAVRQVFRTSSRNFADLLLVPHRREGDFVRSTNVIRGDYRLIDDALNDGRGALILTGHVGAFDLMGQVLHDRGYKLTVVTGRTTARFLFDAVTYLRRARGMELVEATPSGVRRAIQAVRRGECAVFVSDRDFFQNGRPVTFFGRETTLPPGVARIARDTGATVVPVFGERLPNGHGINIEPGFKIPKTDDIDEDIRVGLNRVAEILERAIARMPDQWVMFQRVWPLEPAVPVRVFPVGSPLETDILERVGAALPGRRHEKHQR